MTGEILGDSTLRSNVCYRNDYTSERLAKVKSSSRREGDREGGTVAAVSLFTRPLSHLAFASTYVRPPSSSSFSVRLVLVLAVHLSLAASVDDVHPPRIPIDTSKRYTT